MSAAAQALKSVDQAVFSVCADSSVVVAATAAAAQVPGSVFAGEFSDYITPDKRPQFSSFLNDVPSCVALIDCDKDPELAVVTAARLREIFLKRISLVAVGADMDASLLLRAMRAGCAEYLAKPVQQGEVFDALRRFQEERPSDAPAEKGVGRVIVLVGSKGGVGTTTLAVHLATHLVRLRGKKALLIDHKPQLGHVALFLGLKDTHYHFDELLLNSDRLDPELLGRFVVRHMSGLDIIASPEIAQATHKSSRDELERVIGFLREQYEYILLDSAWTHHDAGLMLLDQADAIYLISTPDVAALRDLARLVEALRLNDRDKLHLVINRSTADDSIKGDQIEKAVRFPITVAIPNNYFEVLAAINAGEPVPPQRRSDFNSKLAQWTSQIVTGDAPVVAEPVKKKGKGLGLWR